MTVYRQKTDATAYRQLQAGRQEEAGAGRYGEAENPNTYGTHGEVAILQRCNEFGRPGQSAHCQGRQFVNDPAPWPLTLSQGQPYGEAFHSLPLLDSETCL